MSIVSVVKTNPRDVISDIRHVMELAQYTSVLDKNKDIIIKLNLSWTKFFPSCSTPPWALDGVLTTLLQDGYDKNKIFVVENKTVVTNPRKGAKNNKWQAVLDKHGIPFTPLPEVEWVNWQPKSDLLVLHKIFLKKGGLKVPKMFFGKQILHLPTLKTHGHTQTTGAIKNAFGGLLQEIRHFAHKYIHEAMVDLMILQKEIHPAIFAVMDGTVAGNGAGPRTMKPEIKNYLLASNDSVAIDSVSAKMMGFNPCNIAYLKICKQKGLGQCDVKNIEIKGESIDDVDFHFKTEKSFVIWGDQMLRKGKLQFLEKILLHSPLFFWAPMASNIYHDIIWYPIVGKKRIRQYLKTDWGKLFKSYK